MYKAVHKVDGKYFSDHDNSFTYEIGKTYKHELDDRDQGSCARGLHVAHKSWARAFGINWKDTAILECEVPVKSIVVADDCDGKIRCGELRVIKEVK